MRNIHKENLKVRILHFLNCRFFLNNKKFKDCSFTNQHSTHYYADDIGKSAPNPDPFSHNNKNFASKLCKLFRSVQLLTMEFIKWLLQLTMRQIHMYPFLYFLFTKMQSESWICSRHFARLLLENFYRNGQVKLFN